MNPQDRIPIQATPENHPMKRHHTARYYVHRVQESLTTRVSKLICAIFLALLFFLGIISFILWLSLRPHRPRFHIEEFSIPSLAQANGLENAQLTFNTTARNANHNIGIYYDAMLVTVFYDDQSIGGSQLLYPFYQKPKNTTVLFGTLRGATLTVNNQQWAELMEDRTRGAVNFRLEITSTIRFRVSTWDSKRHKMHASCQVGVGSDGLILATYRDKRCPVYFS